jgi:hypothetical protein
VVTFGGRGIYLGEYDTPESRGEYDRLVAEWLLGGRQSTHAPRDNPDDLTVAELCLRYLEWAAEYYRKVGEPTSEVHNVKRAIKNLRQLYGHTVARSLLRRLAINGSMTVSPDRIAIDSLES